MDRLPATVYGILTGVFLALMFLFFGGARAETLPAPQHHAEQCR